MGEKTFSLNPVDPTTGEPLADGTCNGTGASCTDGAEVGSADVTLSLKKPGQGLPYCFMIKEAEGGYWEDWSEGFYGTHHWRWRNEYGRDYYDERDGTPLPAEISVSGGSVLLQPSEVGFTEGNEARIMWNANRVCEGQDEPGVAATKMYVNGSYGRSALHDSLDGDGPHIRMWVEDEDTNGIVIFHIDDQSCFDGEWGEGTSFPSVIDLAAYGINTVHRIKFHVSMQYAQEGDWAWMRIGGISFE